MFAARSGWNARTLSWWASRLRHPRPVEFVELVPAPSRTDDAIDVVLGDGKRISVRRGFDVELLRAIVRALEAR